MANQVAAYNQRGMLIAYFWRPAIRSAIDQSNTDAVLPISVIARLPNPLDNPESLKYYARWNGGDIEGRQNLRISLSLTRLESYRLMVSCTVHGVIAS